MTTGNKIMLKRGEIAPKEQFLLFSTLFYIYISNFRSQITYSFVKCGCSIYYFTLSQLWYIEVRISRSVSVSPLEFEITTVDYTLLKQTNSQDIFVTSNCLLTKAKKLTSSILHKVLEQTGLSKQYKPRSDAAFCSIWFGSILFANQPASF